jgi:hypothetical protein
MPRYFISYYTKDTPDDHHLTEQEWEPRNTISDEHPLEFLRHLVDSGVLARLAWWTEIHDMEDGDREMYMRVFSTDPRLQDEEPPENDHTDGPPIEA